MSARVLTSGTAATGPAPEESMNPYQQTIRAVTAVSDPADLEAIEEMMRTGNGGVLDGLSAGAFAEEARQCWIGVRASRLMTAAGITGSASLDPGLHTAACVHVHSGAPGPLTRPLTFRLPAGFWRTYHVPAADWQPDMPMAQAAAYGIGAGTAGLTGNPEAICRRCGEIFNPDLTYPDGTGIEHYEDAAGRECGGRGDICGWWG